jgi:dTDP-glucose 4,6-dehydratase
MTLLITGGAGFIGSNFIRHILSTTSEKIINLDKLTYAGNLQSLEEFQNDQRLTTIHGDICDSSLLQKILTEHHPRSIINFAAESHVDRSIYSPDSFIQTNIVGTFTLLDTSKEWWKTIPENEKNKFRFVHISTDEVYGSLTPHAPAFSEDNKYLPNSPYSASKASSDHLVRAYFHTYGLPVITTNCSNNYGPYQFPEKLIPLIIQRALSADTLPVYGDGQNVRDWLYVTDHCKALYLALENGTPGETYNIGGNNEIKNIDVVNILCDILDRDHPKKDGTSYRTQITFVTDRPGHDHRYAINANKMKNTLGWTPNETFSTGIEKTVKWYIENDNWVKNVTSGNYRNLTIKH